MPPTATPSTDDESRLVAALRQGDEQAFARLVDRYHASMVRVARAYVATQEAAEDVVQDAWLGVIKGLDRFEAGTARSVEASRERPASRSRRWPEVRDQPGLGGRRGGTVHGRRRARRRRHRDRSSTLTRAANTLVTCSPLHSSGGSRAPQIVAVRGDVAYDRARTGTFTRRRRRRRRPASSGNARTCW